jgi:hypothetical protein
MRRFFSKKVLALVAVGAIAIGGFSFAYPGGMGGYGGPLGTNGSPAFSGTFGRNAEPGTWGHGYGMMGGFPGGRGYGRTGGFAGMPCDPLGAAQGPFDAVDTEEALENYLEEASVELELVDKVTYDTGMLYAVVRVEGEDQPIELIVSPASGFVHSPRGGRAFGGRALQDPLLAEVTAEDARDLAEEALEEAGIDGVLIEGHDFYGSYSFYLEQEDAITHVIHVNKWNGFVRTDARFGTIETVERGEGDGR